MTLVFTNAVTNAQLQVLFTPVVDNARLSGIQVRKIGDVFSDSDGIPDWWRLAYFGHALGQAGDKSGFQSLAAGGRRLFRARSRPGRPARGRHQFADDQTERRGRATGCRRAAGVVALIARGVTAGGLQRLHHLQATGPALLRIRVEGPGDDCAVRGGQQVQIRQFTRGAPDGRTALGVAGAHFVID